MFHVFFILEQIINDAEENLKNGLFCHRSRIDGKNGKLKSEVWKTFHLIYDTIEEKRVDCLYLCIDCNKVVYNRAQDGNTNAFHRHVCKTTTSEKIKPTVLVSSRQKENLKRAAAQYIAKDLRPYHAMDCDGLFDLCKAVMEFGQKYPKASSSTLKSALPSRNTVKSAVHDISNDARNEIRKILNMGKEAGGFAATTDCWTDKYRNLTYICITVHVNTVGVKSIKNNRLVIHLDQITELVKSKRVITGYICEVFKNYGFTEDDIRKYVIFVTDRGGNIRYGLRSIGFKRLNCYAHLLYNLVKAMLCVDEVKVIVENASKLSSYVKRTGLNFHLKTSLKSFSKTRWNYAYIMLEKIVENYDAIYDILLEKQRATKKENILSMITELNKDEMHAICQFLKIFKEMTDLLEGDINETLHYVWPSYFSLIECLTEEAANFDDPISNLIERMKACGRDYMRKNATDFQPTIHHKIATFLHPLMRRFNKAIAGERESIYKEIEEIMEVHTPIENTQHEEAVQTASNTQLSFISEYFEHDVDSYRKNNSKHTEFQNYLKNTIPMNGLDLKTWWYNNRFEFPNLFQIFLRHSCIPATSAPSERCFSQSGLIVTNLRSTILPSNVNDIIIARNKLN